MASQIKKGFFFYFGLFVIVLVAIFMVCVVIMMFNPGSSILWMQYFSSNETIYVNETTDDSTEFSFSNINSIEVECGFADVTVAYDDSTTYTQTGIYIVNNAKGFVASSAATSFNYSVTYNSESGLLSITVSEPNGFLYFSKDIEIVIHSSYDWGSPDLSSIAFKISTTDGDVNIGGTVNKNDKVSDMGAKSLEISTKKGDITLSKNFDTTTVSSMKLSTESGTISSSSKFTSSSDTSKTTTGIKASCDVSLVTESGRIELKEISIGTHTLTITNKSGDVVLGDVIARYLKFSECAKGNYALDSFSGTETYFGSNNTLSTAYLDFGTIDGNFTLDGGTTSSQPTINLDEVTGALSVTTLAGTLNVGKAESTVEINASGALKVTIVVSDEATTTDQRTIKIANTTAAVYVGFSGSTSNVSFDVSSNSGTITVDFTTSAKFLANMYSDSESTLMSDNKINLNLGNEIGTITTKNPFSFEATGSYGTFNLVTSSSVNFNLVSASSF